jgi:mannose-1-phosphate guanylyltransferase
MPDWIVSFVMSGGIGSRLWPLSREDNPKQFHDLSGDGSMLAKTVRRLKARPEGEAPIYVIRDSADQFRMTGFGHQWKLVWAAISSWS